MNLQVYELLATDQENQKNDPYIFPNLMGDEIAAKMPMSIVFSTEFDFYLGGSLELATLLKRNGRLLDLCISPGAQHAFYLNYAFPNTDIFYSDFAKAIKVHLK